MFPCNSNPFRPRLFLSQKLYDNLCKLYTIFLAWFKIHWFLEAKFIFSEKLILSTSSTLQSSFLFIKRLLSYSFNFSLFLFLYSCWYFLRFSRPSLLSLYCLASFAISHGSLFCIRLVTFSLFPYPFLVCLYNFFYYSKTLEWTNFGVRNFCQCFWPSGAIHVQYTS